MTVRIGINGFGRIGRNVLRAAFNRPGLEFVAVNDLPTPTATTAHLLKYDSVHGTFAPKVEANENSLSIDGKELKIFNSRTPEEIPWSDLGVDIVVESTGVFTEREKAEGHLKAGAKKVIISAPAKGEDVSVVMGVNEGNYDAAKHTIISNASCTTNCVAPMAKIVHENFKIERGFMTTIHSYTNDQKVLDLAHKDLRRARAAALSMIPSSTGAARLVGKIFPELNGKIDGTAIRVPTPNVSLVDLSCQVSKSTTAEAVNEAFKAAAEGPLKGFLQFETDPLVSKDFNGNPHSCVIDAAMTTVIDGHLVKVFGWYDNEWGYSNRVVDLIAYIAKQGLGSASAQKAAAA